MWKDHPYYKAVSALIGASDKKNCHSLIYHPHPLPIRVGIIIHSLPAGIQRLLLNNLPQAVSDRLRKCNWSASSCYTSWHLSWGSSGPSPHSLLVIPGTPKLDFFLHVWSLLLSTSLFECFPLITPLNTFVLLTSMSHTCPLSFSPSHLLDHFSSISISPGLSFSPFSSKCWFFPRPSSPNTPPEQFQHLHASKWHLCARDFHITLSRTLHKISLFQDNLQGLLPSSLASLQEFLDLTHSLPLGFLPFSLSTSLFIAAQCSFKAQADRHRVPFLASFNPHKIKHRKGCFFYPEEMAFCVSHKDTMHADRALMAPNDLLILIPLPPTVYPTLKALQIWPFSPKYPSLSFLLVFVSTVPGIPLLLFFYLIFSHFSYSHI